MGMILAAALKLGVGAFAVVIAAAVWLLLKLFSEAGDKPVALSDILKDLKDLSDDVGKPTSIKSSKKDDPE